MLSHDLNEKVWNRLQRQLASDEFDDSQVHRVAGATIVDCGVIHPGGFDAGKLLADACFAGRGSVSVSMGTLAERPCPIVTVETSQPVLACLGSQYAGWALSVGSYFAMASGPARLLVRKEKVLADLGLLDPPAPAEKAVLVLEASKLPDETVVQAVSEATACRPEGLLILAARTASLPGSLQVVARSVETCLHKLHELGFDVRTIRSAVGTAWLPTIPTKDIVAIGRTNDSILYGSQVCLWVDTDDETLERVIEKTPACASADYGEPFGRIFARYGGDFYKIDPLLFSPALVRIDNLRTGRVFQGGRLNKSILAESFFSDHGAAR